VVKASGRAMLDDNARPDGGAWVVPLVIEAISLRARPPSREGRWSWSS